ncbi:MAG: hypothetical protein A2062_05915 [Omnitrophica WOR_2 bacterium GWA2_44_7]|nr:MAG: hypothetical protein A2062_05915 [Omnitrophica WOR_2 bacterium GWA2_44_7]
MRSIFIAAREIIDKVIDSLYAQAMEYSAPFFADTFEVTNISSKSFTRHKKTHIPHAFDRQKTDYSNYTMAKLICKAISLSTMREAVRNKKTTTAIPLVVAFYYKTIPGLNKINS